MYEQDQLQQSMHDFANSLADLVRPLALEYFRHPLDVESKADSSPVTIADRNIEKLLRERIRERFPEHGILGEEFGAEGLDNEYVWSVDPIDGTKSFVSGMPTFGTLIAVLKNKTPVMGVVDMPALSERWTGLNGHDSVFNGKKCQTRTGVDLKNAVLYSTSPEIFTSDAVAGYQRLSKAVGLHRFGGDCYSYGMLASGWIDAVVEASLQPYDYLCLPPIIEGAGGVITDWEGRPLGIESDGKVLAAATPQLHALMLEQLQSKS